MHTRHECLWTTHVSLHHTCRPDALALRSFWWFSAQCWEMEKFKIFLEYDPTKLNTISYSCRWHFWKFGKTFMKLSKKSVAKPSMRVSRYRIQFCVVLHLHLRQYDVKHLLALSKNCFFFIFQKFYEIFRSFTVFFVCTVWVGVLFASLCIWQWFLCCKFSAVCQSKNLKR